MPFCKWPDGCECYTEGNTEYCGTHNLMLRKQERNKNKEKKVYALPKTTKKIKHRSDKRAAEERVYNKIVGPWKEGKTCGVKGCEAPCTENHHKRGRIGKLLLDIRWWFPACHDHHVYINEHPDWALENEYSLPRLEKID